MRSSLICCFHTCEVPTCEKWNATVSYNCNFAKSNRGINTSLTIRSKSSLWKSSLTGIFCWNPQSQSSAIQINTVADPDRKTFNPIFSRWQWWMAVCFYLFGFPGNGVLLSLVITWSALTYKPAQWPCTLPDRYSGGFTHCLDVMSARKKLNFTTLLGLSFLKLHVLNLWQTLGTGLKEFPGKADTSHA